MPFIIIDYKRKIEIAGIVMALFGDFRDED